MTHRRNFTGGRARLQRLTPKSVRKTDANGSTVPVERFRQRLPFAVLRYGRSWRVYYYVTRCGTPRYEPVGGAIYDTESQARTAARKLEEAALAAIRNVSEKQTKQEK